jgi:hypothetical protein
MQASAAYLAQSPSDYVDGEFRPLSGDGIVTRDPALPSRIVWMGTPVASHAEDAVAAARRALPSWRALSFDERRAYLERWREACVRHAGRLAAAISREVGKVKWEAELEAKIVAEKVLITLEERVLARVAGFEVAAGAGKAGICAFRPHGVITVLGPYNFPAHLPNGHIVPALLVGNTVVFKPSEKGASVGQVLAEIAHEVGFPAGVFNVVQGGGAIASRLATHPEVDGVLFTGSFPVGRRILEANLDTPGRLIALEMGEVETLTPIKLRYTGRVIDLENAFDKQNIMHSEPVEYNKQDMETTVGRVILNDVLPDDMPFINGLLKKGAARDRLEAKLFGGARTMQGLGDIGATNGRFAQEFLRREGITITGGSLGGETGRRIQFWPASGRRKADPAIVC